MVHGGFLTDIAVVLGVAAITSYFAKKFKLPSILGYLFAGFVIGPYIPIPLFADLERVETLSEFGVILVMFAVGLEFRLKRLFQVLPNAGFTAFIEMSTMFLIGTLVADLFGWTTTQGIFLGSAICISSTMLVSKVFEEQPPLIEVRRQIFGILIIQDIAAILILALLGTVAAGYGTVSPKPIDVLTQLVGFLIAIGVVGLFFIPKFVRKVSKLKSQEAMIVVSMGICFAMALLVEQLGYSVALGSFLAGMLVSESGLGNKIEHIISPIKDMFAAIFFVSIGMQVNPGVAVQFVGPILLISFLVIVFQFITVSFSGVLSGMGLSNSIKSGLGLGQIGEFGFIIAAIGAKAGLVQDYFQTIVVSVAIVTAFTTPIIWKSRQSVLKTVDRLLPKQIDVLINLYEAWFSKLKKQAFNEVNLPRRILFAVFIDVILLVAFPPLLLAVLPKIKKALLNLELSYGAVQVVIASTFVAIFIPIVFSLISNIGKLLSGFVDQIFKWDDTTNSTTSFKASKLFKMAVQILVLYVIWIPLMISVRTFVSNNLIYYIILTLGLLLTFVLIYRSESESSNILSGGERILGALSRQSFPDSDELETLGLDLISVRITNTDVIDKTLLDINLRAKTGCSVVSIKRGNNRTLFPRPTDTLQLNDLIQLSGDDRSITEAKKLLI